LSEGSGGLTEEIEKNRIKELEQGYLTLKVISEVTQESVHEIKSDVKDIKESVNEIQKSLEVNAALQKYKNDTSLWLGIKKNTANILVWVGIVFMFFMVLTHLDEFRSWEKSSVYPSSHAAPIQK